MTHPHTTLPAADPMKIRGTEAEVVGALHAAMDAIPTNKDLEMLIKPLWFQTRPGSDAQGIRAAISVAVDSPSLSQWALDYVPDYVWDLLDIAAQRGIEMGLEKAAAECDRHAAFLHKEAHAGGDFRDLMDRHGEAIYNAARIRAIAALGITS